MEQIDLYINFRLKSQTNNNKNARALGFPYLHTMCASLKNKNAFFLLFRSRIKFATIQIEVRPQLVHCVIHLITISLSPCSTNRINAGYQVSVVVIVFLSFSLFFLHENSLLWWWTNCEWNLSNPIDLRWEP